MRRLEYCHSQTPLPWQRVGFCQLKEALDVDWSGEKAKAALKRTAPDYFLLQGKNSPPARGGEMGFTAAHRRIPREFGERRRDEGLTTVFLKDTHGGAAPRMKV